MRPLRALLICSLASLAPPVAGGEIIFVDPVREKAQEIRQDEQEQGRHDQLRDRMLDAARGYRDDGQPPPPPPVILKSGPPPSDAAQAREAARTWADRQPATTSANRCKTENTVGGIEGSSQGRTVIQGSAGGVNAVCK